MGVLHTPSLLLISASPRRRELLLAAGFDFRVAPRDVDERLPPDLAPGEAAEFLAAKKGRAGAADRREGEILLAADTLVVMGERVLGKPDGPEEAVAMLAELAGGTHRVITGVYLFSGERELGFHETTRVTIAGLSPEEIAHYVEAHRPFDKAGAYAVQEWIGMVGIPRIEGCYYNVVGLPLPRLWRTLRTWPTSAAG